MAKAEVTFTVPMDIVVTVEIPEGIDAIEADDYAGEEAWKAAQEFCDTIMGDHRRVRATADMDGLGSNSITVTP